MDFAGAWSLFSTGDQVAVSDGTQEPANHAGQDWRCWKSHNFTGSLSVKASGSPRSMTFSLSSGVAYTLSETAQHVFSVPAGASMTAGQTETVLLAQIDAQREALQQALITTGQAKKYVYAQKAREYADYRDVLGGVITALTVPNSKVRFPAAWADAAITTGKTSPALTDIAAALIRFRDGVDATMNEILRIDAVATKAKRAIRSASTAAAKAAAANVNWSQGA